MLSIVHLIVLAAVIAMPICALVVAYKLMRKK